MFEINMSRNKFIKFLHEKSDKPFSELRSILKKNKWNMSDTYLELFIFGFDYEAMKQIVDEIYNGGMKNE